MTLPRACIVPARLSYVPCSDVSVPSSAPVSVKKLARTPRSSMRVPWSNTNTVSEKSCPRRTPPPTRSERTPNITCSAESAIEGPLATGGGSMSEHAAAANAGARARRPTRMRRIRRPPRA
jgi:hypothetical protein